MAYPHFATLLGAVSAAAVVSYHRRARPVGVRVVLVSLALISGAAAGALIDAGVIGVLAAWGARIVAASATVDWSAVLAELWVNLPVQQLVWVTVAVVVVALVVARLGFGHAVRTMLHRAAFTMGAGAALVLSTAILLLTKLPEARQEGGLVLVAMGMLGAFWVSVVLFGRRGVYWRLPGANPTWNREPTSLRPPPVRRALRFLLTRVLKVEQGEADRLLAQLDRGAGAVITGTAAEASIATEAAPRAAGRPPRRPARLRSADDVDALLAALRSERASQETFATRQRHRVVLIAVLAVGIVPALTFLYFAFR